MSRETEIMLIPISPKLCLLIDLQFKHNQMFLMGLPDLEILSICDICEEKIFFQKECAVIFFLLSREIHKNVKNEIKRDCRRC